MFEIAIVLILIGVIFALVGLSMTIDGKEHAPLKLLFILIALILCIVSLNFGLTLAVDYGLSEDAVSMVTLAYKVIMFTFIPVMLYFTVYFLITTGKLIQGAINRKDE